ncbi:MAG: beta-N-acetylhexosaminidase [Bdellovibrionales bacterium]|nr:beta-N-acetylhexosaminidase [Bdellovibrionales bacterium]
MKKPLSEIQKQIGSCLMRGLKGPQLTKEEKDHLLSHEVAGVILFQRNILSFKQVYELCRELKELYPVNSPPPLIAVDLEGGSVNRFSHLKESFPWPSAEKLGQLKTSEISLVAEIMGRQLSTLGIDINFAPVVDVPLTQGSLLKGRTFDQNPETIISCAKAFTEGLIRGGTLPCLKHFPGHGGVSEDSHKTLPKEEGPVEGRTALKPFEALKHCPLIMTAHIEFQKEAGPATFSSYWLETVLRKQMQFQGLIVSDDIDMEALASYSSAERFTKALSGGCDLVLCCQKPETPLEIDQSLVEQPEPLQFLKSRLEISAQRINRLRQSRKKRVHSTWQEASQILFSSTDWKKLESLII